MGMDRSNSVILWTNIKKVLTRRKGDVKRDTTTLLRRAPHLLGCRFLNSQTLAILRRLSTSVGLEELPLPPTLAVANPDLNAVYSTVFHHSPKRHSTCTWKRDPAFSCQPYAIVAPSCGQCIRFTQSKRVSCTSSTEILFPPIRHKTIFYANTPYRAKSLIQQASWHLVPFQCQKVPSRTASE